RQKIDPLCYSLNRWLLIAARASRRLVLFVVDDNLKIAEISEAIRLGPKPDLPRTTECRIACLDNALPVKGHFEKITFDFEEQRVPGTSRDFEVLAGNLPTFATDDLVQSDIVFKCICARDVIIELILDARHDSARLIDAARNRFEL